MWNFAKYSPWRRFRNYNENYPNITFFHNNQFWPEQETQRNQNMLCSESHVLNLWTTNIRQPRLRALLDSHHVKGSQKPMKSSQQHFYPFVWSIWEKKSENNWVGKRLLVIAKILGLFAYILTADDKYSLHKRESIPQSFQKQLSKKSKTFCQFFATYLKCT